MLRTLFLFRPCGLPAFWRDILTGLNYAPNIISFFGPAAFPLLAGHSNRDVPFPAKFIYRMNGIYNSAIHSIPDSIYPERSALNIFSAVRERFELSVRFNPYDGLANRWFKPLTHLTVYWLKLYAFSDLTEQLHLHWIFIGRCPVNGRAKITKEMRSA